MTLEMKKIENCDNDHDLLIRIDTRIQDLIRDNRDFRDKFVRLEEKKVDKEDLAENIARPIKDHELRIRRVERFASIAFGFLLLLQIILGIK